MSTTSQATGRSVSPDELDDAFQRHRRELTGYCYRMLGSGAEAEDAVQETMVRAWRSIDGFEGRSSLRSWLYRIATNICLDMLRSPQRRARPMDLGPSSTAESALDAGLPEQAWVHPVHDARVLPTSGDPAEIAEARETVRLAFVAALQHLPARQRAALILFDVLRWQASEVADLLGSSTASVNSALQRARATLESARTDGAAEPQTGAEHGALVSRYVEAFENYDIGALVALLRDDVEFSMPPYALWLQGPDQVAGWLTGTGKGCRGSRLLATSANGCAAFGSYRVASPDAPEGVTHQPFALQVIETRDGAISAWHNFLYPERFADFGLPEHLTADD